MQLRLWDAILVNTDQDRRRPWQVRVRYGDGRETLSAAFETHALARRALTYFGGPA